MGSKSQWPWIVGGLAAGIGGFYLFSKKKTIIPDTETLDALPDENVEVKAPSVLLQRSKSYHRSPPAQGTITLNPNLGFLNITIKPVKFIVNYDKDQWPSDSDIHGLFDVGQILSNSAGNKLIKNFGINMGSKDFAVASTPQEFAQFTVSHPATLGVEPPGIKSPYGSNGKTSLALPAGVYAVTPSLDALQQHHVDFYTGFWKMTTHGPSIPSGSWFFNRLSSGKCTKYWTKITMSNGGSPIKSMKSVTVTKKKTTSVTLQPYNIISIRRKVWQNAESKAFNAMCETFGYVGDKVPDWAMNLFKKFSQWVD